MAVLAQGAVVTVDRRDFLKAAAAFGALPPLAGTRPWPARSRWPGYEEAVVIDFLGSPGYFNYPEARPMDEQMIRNAAASGITAMNVTVSSGDFEGSVRRASEWLDQVSARPDVFRQVRTLDELMAAKKDGQVGIVFGFQDTTPYGQDLSRIDTFHDMGVRVTQLTYNVRNLVGDGCLEPGNAGLSTFGHAVVERLNETRTLVDLSHCGQRTTAEGIAASRVPASITHSGCNAVEAHPRSKNDTELRALADGGGVVGIYLMPFLTPGRVPTAADVFDHIEHALNVCGEEHVGIGSDLSISPIDGSDEYWSKHREFVSRRIAAGIAAPAEDPDVLFTVPDLNSHRRMEMIADGLAARGHSDRVVEGVIGGNWLRLCREVWG